MESDDTSDLCESAMSSTDVKCEPSSAADLVTSTVISPACTHNSPLISNGVMSSISVIDSSSDDAKQDFDAFCRFAFPENRNDAEYTAGSSDPYYFESDHVALKGNEDYRRLVRAFVLLESQRTSALRDLDVLLQLQQQALSDPLKFAAELQRGTVKTMFPRRQKVADLPTVPWERYTDDTEAVLASLGGAPHTTRHKQKRELMSGIRDSAFAKHSNSSTSPAAGITVDPSRPKPVTFNQPWSAEEQQHLEQLLHKYPPERFEARRFSKIAAELPGRTTQQVTSRVQKYFIKLAKAGLPVPGRMPNLAAYGGRWFGGRLHGHHQRNNHFYYPQSTFLTSYAPPVYMSDDDDDASDHYDYDISRTDFDALPTSSVAMTSDDEIPKCLRDSDEYRELRRLTALRRSRLHRSSMQTATVGRSVDHTKSDSNFLLNSAGAAAADSPQIDRDYTAESTGVSSYLDPNYMPAV